MTNLFKRIKFHFKYGRIRLTQRTSTKVTYWTTTVIFSLFSLVYAYLLFWLIIACFKSHTELALHPWSMPKEWRWHNFIEMFEVFEFANTTMLGMIWNSVWHSIGSTILQVWATMSIAYLCTKYKFPGSRFIPPYLMTLLIFPLYGSSGAGYRLVHAFGFVNSPTILITACTLTGWNFFYFQAFFSNVSNAYAEAAVIDGANDWDILYRIIFPQSFGICGAIAITAWATAWQDYSSQILYMDKMPTLSVGIYFFKNEMVYRARMDILYCACLVSMIPIFTLYATFNNLLFTNISLGGIKE